MLKIKRKHFSKIDSTNTWAKKNVPVLEENQVLLVTADEQNAGRGQFRRTWISPPNQNIYATFCFYLDKDKKISNLPQVLALSVCEILEELEFTVKLKWPNDLLISNKKVGGILSETTMVDNKTVCLIMGIGLNVNMTQEILQTIDKPATSLMCEKGTPFDIEKLIDCLQTQFLKNLQLFLKTDFTPFLKQFTDKSHFQLGQKLKFYDHKIIWDGYFESILPDGSLNLKLEKGEVKNFYSGEILWN